MTTFKNGTRVAYTYTGMIPELKGKRGYVTKTDEHGWVHVDFGQGNEDVKCAVYSLREVPLAHAESDCPSKHQNDGNNRCIDCGKNLDEAGTPAPAAKRLAWLCSELLAGNSFSADKYRRWEQEAQAEYLQSPAEPAAKSGTWSSGPWYDGHNVSHDVTVRSSDPDRDNGGFAICICYGPRARDNARLIKAAPDLANALQAILPEVDSEIEQRQTSANDEYWHGLKALSDAGHAAIARAEGR